MMNVLVKKKHTSILVLVITFLVEIVWLRIFYRGKGNAMKNTFQAKVRVFLRIISAFLVGAVVSALLLGLVAVFLLALQLNMDSTVNLRIGSLVILETVETEDFVGLSAGLGFPVVCIGLGLVNAVISEFVFKKGKNIIASRKLNV